MCCYCLHTAIDRQIHKQCSKHFLSHNVFVLTWQLISMLFSNRLQMRGGKINSMIFKEKQVWQQEEKEMSNTSVSAFQKGLFESSVVPQVLTHPWHFSASTFTLKQSKLLNGGVKQGWTGEQWGIHIVCTWECSLRSYRENLIILQVTWEKRKFAFNSQPG